MKNKTRQLDFWTKFGNSWWDVREPVWHQSVIKNGYLE